MPDANAAAPKPDDLNIDENSTMTDTPDGGVEIDVEEQQEEAAISADNEEQFRNLAEELDEEELSSIARQLVELIEEDIESRSSRDQIYAEGIRRTGLGGEAPGGADFEGASRVVHPMLVEACIDFASRAMKELFPAAGPVKQHIPGTPSKDKVEKSRRKVKLMNWQLMKQIKGFRSELKQTLTQAPLGGAGYLKVYRDERYKRPAVEFIPIDDMIYPNAAASFDSAERKTHRRRMTEMKIKKMVDDGIYRDIELAPPDEPETTEASKASDKVEGKDNDPENIDGVRTIYETACYLDVEEDGEFNPYLITIDKTTEKVMSIYRNWDTDDDELEEIKHIVEFPFIQWRGAAPIGFTHLIGSLSGAATGSLRALLDSAHNANSQTAFRLKGGIKGGQSKSPKPGEIIELEGTANNDDIRKLILPTPFNQPSPVLYELLGFVIKEARGVVQTSFEQLSEQRVDMPVGTTLALIEQGMVVFSEIHSCMHNSMQQVLEIIHRLNAKYLTAEDISEDLGEEVAKPEDFRGPMDVIPVSDPNIFSEVQRQAQVALLAQRAAAMAPMNLYNLFKVEKLILEYAKIPGAEDLLNPQAEPSQDNAVTENMKATIGKGLLAFPTQDHEAHIQTHLGYLMHPLFGGSPSVIKSILPAMISHIRDHVAFWYVAACVDLASQAAGMDVSKLMDINDEEVSKGFDRAIAAASDQVLQMANQNPTLSKLPPIIQSAMDFIQKNQPPTPMDPSLVAAQDVQRRAAADQQSAQLNMQKLQLDAQAAQHDQQKAAQQVQMNAMKMQLDQQTQQLKDRELQLKETETQRRTMLDAQKLQQDAEAKQMQIAAEQQRIQNDARTAQLNASAAAERNQLDNKTRTDINTADNVTALTIARAEIESGNKIGISTGTGINPG